MQSERSPPLTPDPSKSIAKLTQRDSILSLKETTAVRFVEGHFAS
jgi:hypothetical protein